MGFAGELQLRLTAVKPRLRGYCTDSPFCIDCFVFQCFCRARRLDAPLSPQAVQRLSLRQKAYYTTRTKWIAFRSSVIAASSANLLSAAGSRRAGKRNDCAPANTSQCKLWIKIIKVYIFWDETTRRKWLKKQKKKRTKLRKFKMFWIFVPKNRVHTA